MSIADDQLSYARQANNLLRMRLEQELDRNAALRCCGNCAEPDCNLRQAGGSGMGCEGAGWKA
jgi:hypothetical protein